MQVLGKKRSGTSVFSPITPERDHQMKYVATQEPLPQMIQFLKYYDRVYLYLACCMSAEFLDSKGRDESVVEDINTMCDFSSVPELFKTWSLVSVDKQIAAIRWLRARKDPKDFWCPADGISIDESMPLFLCAFAPDIVEHLSKTVLSMETYVIQLLHFCTHASRTTILYFVYVQRSRPQGAAAG